MTMSKRRWQWVYRAKPGWHIVLSRLANARDRGERWETELSMPREGVRLYYHRSRRAALRHLRRLGIKPVRVNLRARRDTA